MSPYARTTDPHTSHAAAASVDRDQLPWIQRNIVTLLALEGAMTDDQIAYLWHNRISEPVSPSGLRTRRKELTDLGRIKDSGKREKLPSGRYAILWELA